MSARCPHDRHHWYQWAPPANAKRRPGILGYFGRKLADHICVKNPKYIAEMKHLDRQTRSERRETIAAMCKLYAYLTDLVSQRIGTLYPNGRLQGVSLQWCADQSNGRFSLSRIERAHADMVAADLFGVLHVARTVVDVGTRGLAAARVWRDKTIMMLGAHFARAWVNERKKAAERATTDGRYKREQRSHMQMAVEKLAIQGFSRENTIRRAVALGYAGIMTLRRAKKFLTDHAAGLAALEPEVPDTS